MCILCNYRIINLKEIYLKMHRKNLKRDRNHSFDSVTFCRKDENIETNEETKVKTRAEHAFPEGICICGYQQKLGSGRVVSRSKKSSRGQREGEIEWFEVAFPSVVFPI